MDRCPICGDPACPTAFYAAVMWSRYAAGRDREHWRRLHDRLAGGGPTPMDRELRDHLDRHGCGGCG